VLAKLEKMETKMKDAYVKDIPIVKGGRRHTISVLVKVRRQRNRAKERA
jgi:hypothetical protein